MAIPLLNVGDQFTAAIEQQLAAAVNAFINPARFDGYNTAAQSIPASTFTALAMNAENVDTVNGHDNTTNNTRYTIQSGFAGSYLVVMHSTWAANNTGRRGCAVQINGLGSIPLSYSFVGATAAVAPAVTGTYMTGSLNVGDYIEMLLWQDTAGALSTFANQCGMQCFLIGS